MLADQPLSTVYPEEAWRPVTSVLYLLAVGSLSSMLSSRIPSRGDWSRLARMEVALLAALATAYVPLRVASRLSSAHNFASLADCCSPHWLLSLLWALERPLRVRQVYKCSALLSQADHLHHHLVGMQICRMVRACVLTRRMGLTLELSI